MCCLTALVSLEFDIGFKKSVLFSDTANDTLLYIRSTFIYRWIMCRRNLLLMENGEFASCDTEVWSDLATYSKPIGESTSLHHIEGYWSGEVTITKMHNFTRMWVTNRKVKDSKIRFQYRYLKVRSFLFLISSIDIYRQRHSCSSYENTSIPSDLNRKSIEVHWQHLFLRPQFVAMSKER